MIREGDLGEMPDLLRNSITGCLDSGVYQQVSGKGTVEFIGKYLDGGVEDGMLYGDDG
jgi:hypothetical protein